VPVLKRITSSVLAILAGALLLMTAHQSPAQPAPGKESPEQICKACHAPYVESYEASIHGKKGHPRAPANAGGCSACHGDGTAHAAAGGGRGVGGIINPGPRSKSMTADAKSNICLSCHSGQRHLAFWDSGRHRQNDVACSNCHNPHGGNPTLYRTDYPPIRQLVTTQQFPQQEVCFTCHRDIRALVLRPSHHPIIEGKIKCSDCHNPHGALSPSMVNAESVNKLCTSCHADKRGPFVFEHPPVEENCLNCHNPHGSRSTKLLKERVPNLCQDCHDWTRHPGSPYDNTGAWLGSAPSNRLIARACLNCHNEIHGSNAPASRGRRFVR
jgi:DmsE family decaheme c-type cytochrome